MEKTILQLHKMLTAKKKTIAVAESCTGGLLSKLLTDIPGSSAYFSLGIVTYSNKAKEVILGIPRGLLIKKGAVSREVAERMSSGVRKKTNADLGVGITGIAGPAGATAGKRTGTVYICAENCNKKICRKFLFKGGRSSVRMHSALQAVRLIKKLI